MVDWTSLIIELFTILGIIGAMILFVFIISYLRFGKSIKFRIIMQIGFIAGLAMILNNMIGFFERGTPEYYSFLIPGALIGIGLI
jgi:hypothetical protein